MTSFVKISDYWYQLYTQMSYIHRILLFHCLSLAWKSIKNQFGRTWLCFTYLSISNWIFTACVACKVQVRNRKKIKFIQHDFQKSSAGQEGDSWVRKITSLLSKWKKKYWKNIPALCIMVLAWRHVRCDVFWQPLIKLVKRTHGGFSIQ